MKAAVLAGPREIVVQDVPTPSIRANEILVKVKAAGICGSDLHCYRSGAKPVPYHPRPVVLGHEISGEVVDIGSAVSGLRVGDRVLGVGFGKCGTCELCRGGRSDLCRNRGLPGHGLSGGFADYVVVPNPALGNYLFVVPESMSFNEAASVEPVSISCAAVHNAALQPNETVVVLGAGMIGQGVAQAVKGKGTRTVIVSEISPKRMMVARELGADLVFNPQETDVVEAVREATSGSGAAIVFECSGAPLAFKQGLQMLQPSGRLLQVAHYEKTVELEPGHLSLLTTKNLTIRGSGGYQWRMALDLVSTGQIRTGPLVTHEFTLDRAQEAFEMALSSDAVKVMIKPAGQ